MKFSYFNILLFSLPLNILINDRSKYNSPKHTPNTKPTKSHRSLCECELYAPSNYDNDPEMKYVMENYNQQTVQRFKEYDERMNKNRQKCKEQCDKDIQKMILKDKIEKELTEKLSTLQTDISIDDIPTCVCEKSIADKVEKICLKCGYGLGSNVPLVGLISGVGIYASAQSAAVKVGVTKATELIKGIHQITNLPGFDVTKIVTPATYCNRQALVTAIQELNIKMCVGDVKDSSLFCYAAQYSPPSVLRPAANAAMNAGESASEKFAEMTSVGAIFSDTVIISAIVVVCIAVILLIIYSILRYRRKIKMKKKLQYIKLLNQ